MKAGGPCPRRAGHLGTSLTGRRGAFKPPADGPRPATRRSPSREAAQCGGDDASPVKSCTPLRPRGFGWPVEQAAQPQQPPAAASTRCAGRGKRSTSTGVPSCAPPRARAPARPDEPASKAPQDTPALRLQRATVCARRAFSATESPSAISDGISLPGRYACRTVVVPHHLAQPSHPADRTAAGVPRTPGGVDGHAGLLTRVATYPSTVIGADESWRRRYRPGPAPGPARSTTS